MKKENIHIYVFEDFRPKGAKNKNVRELIKPEINMEAENRSVSGKK
jgi:hypothetical protein